MRSLRNLGTLVFLLCAGAWNVACADELPAGWSQEAARPEIRPIFEWDPRGGPQQQGALLIRADDRQGLAGFWTRSVPVTGGTTYQFAVARRTSGMALSRRSAIARIIWLDEQQRPVLRAEPSFASYRAGERPRAEPEFPRVVPGEDGWDTLQGSYLAPPTATQARLELHFRWGEPHSAVQWSLPRWAPSEPVAARVVRLATVHYQPRSGSTPAEKCAQFEPFLAAAGAQQVDLVVLPETLTYYGTPGSYADVAETIPGPSTDYFGSLAEQHDVHIVAGLIERDGHLIYNVAVLIGPDGNVIGKYRKVALPRGEIEGGLTPGSDYPVFETRFGKVGMMVCYDGFFPEVARELTNRGAEVIAWPVWGCNPLLASARACENHVFLVSSTYTDTSADWMISAIYGHDGRPLAKAEKWGELVVAQVDLAQPLYWHSLGDFQAQIQVHRPELQPLP